MLSRTFSPVLGKGSKCPLDLFVHVSAVLRSGSNMTRHLHHYLRQPEPADDFPPKKHPLQNNSRGAPPTYTFESNWTLQHSFSTVKNSDDTPLDSIRRFEQSLATLRSIGNCVNECELSLLLKNKSTPICYVWCDPSPWMHISQGILMTINVNKMIKAGCKVKFLMADWFAQMDRKIGFIAGGDLSKMKPIGWYNVETWKATGMDLDGVEFVWLSELISRNADEYWPLAMDIARKSNPTAIKSWLRFHASIDTRGHGHIDPYTLRDFTAAEILNPCLQSACILFQKPVRDHFRSSAEAKRLVKANEDFYLRHW